jgi:hypothetical protein
VATATATCQWRCGPGSPRDGRATTRNRPVERAARPRTTLWCWTTANTCSTPVHNSSMACYAPAPVCAYLRPAANRSVSAAKLPGGCRHSQYPRRSWPRRPSTFWSIRRCPGVLDPLELGIRLGVFVRMDVGTAPELGWHHRRGGRAEVGLGWVGSSARGAIRRAPLWADTSGYG